MNDYICTIIYQDESNPTFQKLIAKWPNGAFHDKINRLFAGIDEEAINPIIVSDFKDDSGEELTGDALVEVLGPILYAEDRSRPLHIKKSVLSQLYRHPVYQAYIEENNPTQELEII